MKIGREDITKELQKTGLPRVDAYKIVNLFIDTIADSLVKQDEIMVKNFGKFYIAEKNKKFFLNPNTKKISPVSGKYKIKFLTSRNFIKFLNED